VRTSEASEQVGGLASRSFRHQAVRLHSQSDKPALRRYSRPGNVRQLENILLREILVGDNPNASEDLRLRLKAPRAGTGEPGRPAFF
jgi:transcriptional regulator with PAS, ATPase and Fis domain